MQNILLLLSSWHFHNNYYFIQWTLGLGLCSIAISVFVFKRTYSALLGLGVLYFLCQMLYMAYLPENMYQHLGDNRLGLSLNALWEFSSGFLLFLFFIVSPTHDLKKIFNFLPLFGFANSLYVLWNFLNRIMLPQNTGYAGFIEYSGMNGCLIAMCLSTMDFEFRFRKLFIVLLSMTAIVLSGSSMAYGVLVIGLVGRFTPKDGVSLVTVILGISGVAAAFQGKFLFDSSYRFQAYKIFMTEWWKDGSYLFGKGMGSYQYFFPEIQTKYNFQIADGGMWLWRWLHSDWLQTLWQYGICGVVLVIGIFFSAIKRAIKNPRLLGLLFSVASCAVFNYPLRYFPTAFLLCLALVLPFKKEGYI